MRHERASRAPLARLRRADWLMLALTALLLGALALGVCRDPENLPGLRPHGPPPADDRFLTLPPGTTLPDGEDCAGRVRRTRWEPRPRNREANQTTGISGVRIDGASETLNRRLGPRIDGAFTGATDEIIQWASCKWGFDENVVRAVATEESHWRQAATGDDGESFGLLQVKRTVHDGTFPTAKESTAFNLDYALAWRRACYEGDFTWLNDPPQRGGYQRGDEWGCIGAWFSGDWYNQGALAYIARITSHLAAQPWLQRGF